MPMSAVFLRTFDAQVARDAGVDPASFAQDRGEACSLLLRSYFRRHRGSARYLSYLSQLGSFELSDTEQVSLYVPVGCAHGFQARTEPADVSYRIDRPHDPTEDLSIAFDDPELGIPWPLPVSIMSKRDNNAPSLAKVKRVRLS